MIYETGLEAYMDGVALTSLGGICITDISHFPAQLEVTSTPLARAHGEHVLKEKWTKAQTVIEFILLGDSPAKRQEKCQAVVAWAKRGILMTNDRPWQQLNCICTDPPKIGSVIDRVERIRMVFTAYEIPFWEDTIPAEITLSGTSGEGFLFVPGNADTAFVEVEASPVSGTLNNLALTVNGNTITLAGLGATAGNPLRITYSHQLQRIIVGNDSALDKRTGGSADDLIAVCGNQNEFGMTADVMATVRFYARGKWL